MVELYVWLALFLSVIEAALVAYRYRNDPGRGRMLFYAVGAGVLTFILITGLAQIVWRAVFLLDTRPGGGAESPDRAIALNLTTLAAGVVVIVATGVVTAGATLAGVRVGRELNGRPGQPPFQPVTLPAQVAGVPLARLRQMLTDRLDTDELNNLAFDLGVDLDSLPPTGSSGRVRELLEYLHRRGELERVVAWVRERRPDVGL
ncbi:MAG: hypothetical protein KIT87_19855 [Anaerolineae bacterium]|nr:hypothetical protein [Anaerolineae bacterium]